MYSTSQAVETACAKILGQEGAQMMGYTGNREESGGEGTGLTKGRAGSSQLCRSSGRSSMFRLSLTQEAKWSPHGCPTPYKSRQKFGQRRLEHDLSQTQVPGPGLVGRWRLVSVPMWGDVTSQAVSGGWREVHRTEQSWWSRRAGNGNCCHRGSNSPLPPREPS